MSVTELTTDTELELERLPDLEAARADWTRLAELTSNVFSSFEWADAWRRHLAPDVPLTIAACRRPGAEVAAILPLYTARTAPLRLLRLVGSGPSDQLGPVCAAADRAAAASALRRLIAEELGPAGLFVGERLPGDGGFAPLLGGTVVRPAASPVLTIEGRSFDDFLAARSRNFREQVRRRERKLAREHELVYRLTEDPDELERDMRTLMTLHAARWSGGETTAFDGARAAFHLDFAGRALERGWLRLWTLELDGRPAAAWYGLRYGGVEAYYQAGRDPALDAQAVGFVLLAHTIRSAFEDGMRQYRFGLGGEEYKSRFADRDPGVDTVAVAHGVRGRGALAAVRAARRLPDGLRAWVWRTGG
jgi:CelD/BcsL family acetyltransferase involved in cellulose biosynthesis